MYIKLGHRWDICIVVVVGSSIILYSGQRGLVRGGLDAGRRRDYAHAVCSDMLHLYRFSFCTRGSCVFSLYQSVTFSVWAKAMCRWPRIARRLLPRTSPRFLVARFRYVWRAYKMIAIPACLWVGAMIYKCVGCIYWYVYFIYDSIKWFRRVFVKCEGEWWLHKRSSRIVIAIKLLNSDVLSTVDSAFRLRWISKRAFSFKIQMFSRGEVYNHKEMITRK